MVEDTVTVIDDPYKWETHEPPNTEPERQAAIDHVLRSAPRGAVYEVPRAWWNDYVATRERYRRMEAELRAMPKYSYTWHARLWLSDELKDERKLEHPPSLDDLKPDERSTG